MPSSMSATCRCQPSSAGFMFAIAPRVMTTKSSKLRSASYVAGGNSAFDDPLGDFGELGLLLSDLSPICLLGPEDRVAERGVARGGFQITAQQCLERCAGSATCAAARARSVIATNRCAMIAASSACLVAKCRYSVPCPARRARQSRPSERRCRALRRARRRQQGSRRGCDGHRHVSDDRGRT